MLPKVTHLSTLLNFDTLFHSQQWTQQDVLQTTVIRRSGLVKKDRICSVVCPLCCRHTILDISLQKQGQLSHSYSCRRHLRVLYKVLQCIAAVLLVLLLLADSRHGAAWHALSAAVSGHVACRFLTSCEQSCLLIVCCIVQKCIKLITMLPQHEMLQIND